MKLKRSRPRKPAAKKKTTGLASRIETSLSKKSPPSVPFHPPAEIEQALAPKPAPLAPAIVAPPVEVAPRPKPAAGQVWSAKSNGGRRYIRILAVRLRNTEDSYVNAIEIGADGSRLRKSTASPFRAEPLDHKLVRGEMDLAYSFEAALTETLVPPTEENDTNGIAESDSRETTMSATKKNPTKKTTAKPAAAKAPKAEKKAAAPKSDKTTFCLFYATKMVYTGKATIKGHETREGVLHAKLDRDGKTIYAPDPEKSLIEIARRREERLSGKPAVKAAKKGKAA